MPALRFYGFSHARRAIGPAFAIILALSTFAASAASGTYVVLNEIANSSSTGMVRVSPDGAMVSTVSRAVWGTGMVEEANGNLVVVNGKTLQRLTPAFQVSTVATAPAGSNWIAVAVDGAGNFVVADNILHAIWRIFPDGAATLVASYPVSYPQNMEGVSIALDSSGDYILAIDPGATGLLIRMTPAGKVSIVELARMPVVKGGSLAPDGKGNFLLGMNGAIYDVNLSGQIVLVASGSQLCCNLTGLALDRSTGEMLVSLNGVGGVPSLVKVSADGNTFTTLGTGNPDFSKPGAVLIDNLVISGAPAVNSMVHGATNIYTVLAPGEVFVIYGSGLGPADLVSNQPTAPGIYGTQLAGTSVLVNGIAAPILYAWNSQVAAVVPYATPIECVQVTVQYQGAGSPPFLMPIYPASPGIFTSGKGSGQAAAVNQDGLLNDATHPAPAGTIILLYATGEGQTAPAGVDGQVTVPPWPKPLLPVSVTIGGQPAEVLYAGEAPGEIAGVMQLNVRIPGGIPPGSAVPVAISVGGTPNIMQQVTIAVSAGIE